MIAPDDLHKLKEIVTSPIKRLRAFQLLTRNYISRNDIVGSRANNGSYPEAERGRAWLPSLKTRLWTRDQRIRFSFPIHELLEPSLEKLEITPEPCEIIIHHYGKLDQAADRAKGEKYLELGLRKLQEMGETPLALRELAIQAGMLGKHREAIELWRRFLKQEKNNAEAWLNLGSALFAVGRTKEALAAAEQACRLQPLMKEPYFNRSLYELHLGYSAAPVADRLKKLLMQVPDYQAARFLYAAAICLRDGVKSGKKAFTDLYNDSLTSEIIAIAGQELAATLKNNHRTKAAEKIKKATSSESDSSD